MCSTMLNLGPILENLGRLEHHLSPLLPRHWGNIQSVFSTQSQGLEDDILESSIGHWADTAATYCPCRPMEHSIISSSKPCDRVEKTLCIEYELGGAAEAVDILGEPHFGYSHSFYWEHTPMTSADGGRGEYPKIIIKRQGIVPEFDTINR